MISALWRQLLRLAFIALVVVKRICEPHLEAALLTTTKPGSSYLIIDYGMMTCVGFMPDVFACGLAFLLFWGRIRDDGSTG